MRSRLSAAAFCLLAGPGLAASETYRLEPDHSQIVFSYDHFGFSTTWGMFSGFDGTILFDAGDPGASSVMVAFPARTMLTGWQERFDAFMGPDFLDASADEMVSFTSTAIAVTGETTALITGDLTLNGVTRPVVLDTVLNQAGEHPMFQKPWLGFSATTVLVRSEFGLGAFAPFIGDAVTVEISVEAGKAD